MRTMLLSTFLLLNACSHSAFENPQLLQTLCGQSFSGKVVSTDPQDEDWRKEVLTLGPVECSTNETIILPLAVGDNTSRTWVITGQGSTLELRHQHLLEDGTPDPVSEYGGPIRENPYLAGEKWKMHFPADIKTIAIFNANDISVSNTNVWTLEIIPSVLLGYELNRENRHFRAEFDLTNPL